MIKALQGHAPPPAPDGPPPDCEHARTIEKGHGRIETRHITVSREIIPFLDWPGVEQICRIERSREIKGKTSREIVYAITSLPRSDADPAALLALNRDHWAIENRLHWRRDVILHEDASQIRSGAAPQAMAALRNAMLQIVKAASAPLNQIRQTFAENRCDTIVTVKNGFL